MSPSVPFNPFPGLRHFETSEEYLFFGREGQSQEILRRLGQNRLVAVVGTSGSGKSSLVRAGLLPYLYGGFLANTGSHWRVALFRPGIDPIGNLARSLNSPEVLGAADEVEPEARSALLLEVTLRRSGLGLVDAVKLARLAPHENVMVIVDQFEELFRFAGAGESSRSDDDASAFVKLLLGAGRQSEVPVYVALTMRSDWIGDCARFRDLPEAVASGLYLIPRMTRDQRRAAIEEPVRVAQGEISSRLVNRLLNDVGDNPDQLPILQHAMMRTWEYWSAHRSDDAPMDLLDYRAIGTMATALSKHADEAYQELPSERQRAIAKRIFQALTDKDADNREVRRPTSIANLIQISGADAVEVFAVIESFRRRGRSFLMPTEEVRLTNDTIIDISHESLIRGWERLRGWVDEESESAKVYRRLAETAVLHAERKAGLWRDPDLLNALTWEEIQRPTAGWAQRYHPEFDLALAFLKLSRQQRDAEHAEKERRHNDELHRARKQLTVLTTVCAVALAFLAYALYENHRAEGKAQEAARAAEQSSRDKKYADDQFNLAAAAEKKAQEDEARAKKDDQITNQALIAAREQTKHADDMTKTAGAQAEVAKDNEAIAMGYARDSINEFGDLSDEIKSRKDVQTFYAELLQGALDVHTRVLQHDPDNRDALFLGVIDRVKFPDLRNSQGLDEKAAEDCVKNEKYAEDESAATRSAFRRTLGAYTFAATGDTWMRLHQDDKGLQDLRRAITVADSVEPQTDPKDAVIWRILSATYSVAAGAESAPTLRHEALAAYRKAVEARKKSFNDPKELTFAKFYVEDLNEAADLEHQLEQRDNEIHTRTEAVHFTEWLAAQSTSGQSEDDLVFWAYRNRGAAYAGLGNFPEAQKDYDQAHRSAESPRIDPASLEGRNDWLTIREDEGRLLNARADAAAKGAQGTVLSSEEQTQLVETLRNLRHEALKDLGEATGMEKDRVSKSSDIDALKRYVSDLALTAEIENELGEKDAEINTRTEAIESSRTVASRPNVDSRSNGIVFSAYLYRSDLYRDLDHLEQGEADLDEARKWSQRVNPGSYSGQLDRMLVDDRAAKLARARAEQESKHDPTRAQSDLNRAVQFNLQCLASDHKIESDQQTADRHRSFADTESQLATDYSALAALEHSAPARKNDVDHERQYLRDAIKDRETAMASDSSEPDQRSVAAIHGVLGSLETEASEYELARTDLDAQIDLLQPLANRSSGRAADKSALAKSYGSRSWLDLLVGQFDQAVKDADAGISYDDKQVWILVNKAHGFLFLGQREAALALYRQDLKRIAYPDNQEDPKTLGESVLEDFAILRKMPQFDVQVIDQAEKAVRDAMATGGTSAEKRPK